MSWHVRAEDLAKYARGMGDDAKCWSIESHLPGCAVCRARLAELITAEDCAKLKELRTRVQSRATARPPVNVPGPLAAATRGVLGPWWAWIGLVGGAFVGVALLGGVPRPHAGLVTSWSLALAPLVPVAMVAAVYALADRDAAAAATPRGGLELVLMRTGVVLAVAVPTVLLGLRAGGGGGVVWLLPALALCVGALALGSAVGVERACVGLSVMWLVLVAGAGPPVALASAAALIQPAGAVHVLWLVVLLCATAVVTTRRDRFDLPGRPS